MKKFGKILSVGLSLALCASMVMPALAASFSQLQDAIDGKGGTLIDEGTGRYGYAERDDGSFGIEAWDENGTRNVNLNEDVNHEKGDADGGIVIKGKETDVTLNMNGNTINLNPNATLDVKTGTFQDEDGNAVDGLNNGNVISVKNGATLTVNGAGEDGKKGTITGGNKSGGTGGGIYISNSNAEISDVSIEGNKAGDGGGVYITGNRIGSTYLSGSSVTMNGVDISGNVATNLGGGMHVGINNKECVALNNTKIVGNKAYTGGGISVTLSKIVVNTGSVIANNMSTLSGDDVAICQGTLTLPGAETMTDENGNALQLDEDGKPINAWYHDSGSATDSGWGGSGKNAYYKYGKVNGVWSGWGFLKAAHGQYFDVVYSDGADGSLFESQKYEVENESAIPGFNGDVPERPGYTFEGWLVDGESFDPTTGTVTGTLTLVASWSEDETPEPPEETPVNPVPPVSPPTPDETAGPTVEIEAEAVPLAAGPVTRAEFVDYLWRHEGEPAPAEDSGLFEDVTDEHDFSPAMAWAKSVGIIEAYEDGTFQPDELVTVADVRDILDKFAQVFGTNAVAVAELTTLTGEDDEAVLNCDEILAEFFGEEYETLAADEAA